MEQVRFQYFCVFFLLFDKGILEFLRPHPNSVLNVAISLGLRYLTRLRVGLTKLHGPKFYCNFVDSLSPTYDWESY